MSAGAGGRSGGGPLRWGRCAALLVGISACGGKDSGGSGDAGEPVALEGRYNMAINGTAGCDGDAELVDAWARGPLLIRGAGDDLEWDFGEGAVIGGRVDADGAVRLSGDFAIGATTRAVSGEGAARIEGEQRVIEGQMSVVVGPDAPCTIDALYTATELIDLTEG